MLYFSYALTGLAAGILGGFVGVGGAILIVPALIIIFGFGQLKAQGTSLAVLLPPIGLLGFLQYWKNPAVEVDLKAAAVIAAAFLIGGHFGGKWANQVDPSIMRKCFAVFIAFTSVYLFFKK